MKMPPAVLPVVREVAVVKPAGQLSDEGATQLVRRASPFVILGALAGTAVGGYAGYRLVRNWLG